jgi:hypothetical protein
MEPATGDAYLGPLMIRLIADTDNATAEINNATQERTVNGHPVVTRNRLSLIAFAQGER